MSTPSRPLVSVLTPAYERRDTLPRLYESLKAQTLTDFEWVIVDDGSTDGTGELVAGWREQAAFPIVYEWQENRGKHGAFNRAVELAGGEYCALIDSDDWYRPDSLELMVACWESLPAERREQFADVEGLRVDPAGALVCDPYPSDVFDSDAFELIALHGIEGDKVGMFRRSVLAEYPFPDHLGWHVTPALVWNRIAARYATRHVNEVWAYTDYREGGLSDRETELRLRYPEAQLTFWREHAAHPGRMRRKARLRANANCVRYALLSGRGLGWAITEAADPLRTAVAAVPGVALYLRDRLWLARHGGVAEG